MKRVTGIGGIFFKSQDPEKLKAWYRDHLGVPMSPDGYVVFESRELDAPERKAQTVWAPFEKDTRYFDPSPAPFMINYRVANLDEVLEALRSEGLTVDERVDVSELGKFGWVMDPEGNRIELWEPPEPKAS